MAKVVLPLERAHELKGMTLGPTEWKDVTQEVIDKFAEATGDRQWIHVDRERIARESPFGVPVAHGYYSLSLVAALFFEIVEVRGVSMVVNYGLNRVRWPTPLKEGASYRLRLTLLEAKPSGGGHDALLLATIEIEGEAKPGCVAEVVFRFLWT